jgi:hypothetical protein
MRGAKEQPGTKFNLEPYLVAAGYFLALQIKEISTEKIPWTENR